VRQWEAVHGELSAPELRYAERKQRRPKRR